VVSSALGKKSSCLDEIEKLKVNREERRKRMEDVKTQREERERKNAALGHKVDIEFQKQVELKKDGMPDMQPVSKNCCCNNSNNLCSTSQRTS
jgi:hypothetical protein